MPINEILAPCYVKGKYATPVYTPGHAFRLYFATGTTLVPGLTGDENNWQVHSGGSNIGSVSAMLHDLFNRAGTVLPAHTAITEIELWHSVPDAPNVLDHFNTLPESNDFGSGAGIASAYTMHVFGGALRNYFRWTWFDGALVSPQKYPPGSPPDEDDASIGWFFEKSPYPIATNDGIRIVRELSGNTGYNRKLARRYGRSVSP